MTVEDRVKAVVAEIFCCDAGLLSPTTDIGRDLKADSLERIALAVALEKEFGATLPAEVASSIHTVADAVAYLEGSNA